LKAKIADEIGLIGAGGFKAASGHKEEDHGAMDLVASAKVNRGLIVGGTEGALVIELHVHFKF